MILKIMPELRNLIASLSDAEFAQLEKNILTDGCRNPIVEWRGYIVDGHHRYKICTEHGIPFETTTKKFKSRADAKAWIADNQLGRRNLSPFRMIELAMIVNAKLKDVATQNQFRGGHDRATPDQPVDFMQAVADSSGTSRDMVRMFQKIVKIADPKTMGKLRSGEMKIGTAYRMLVEQRTNKTLLDETSKGGTSVFLDTLLVKIQESGDACDIGAGTLDFNAELSKSKAIQNNLERMLEDVMYVMKAVREQS